MSSTHTGRTLAAEDSVRVALGSIGCEGGDRDAVPEAKRPVLIGRRPQGGDM